MPTVAQILVPTPTGLQRMTLEQARAYQAAHRSAVTDPTNPNLTPEARTRLQDPRVQAAIQQRATTTVQVGDTKVHIENGQVTGWEVGGKWKPILAAGAVAATGGLAGAYVGGAGPFAGAAGGGTAASTTAPAGAAGGATTGTAAGAGGSMAGTTAITDPWWGAAPTAGTGSRVASLLTNPNVLSTGIGAGAQLVGAGIASHANTEAAKIQAESFRQALAYEKQRDAYLQGLERQRYSELNQRLEPYMAMGRTQGDRLATLLGVNPASYQYGTAVGADAGPGPVVTPPYPPPAQPQQDFYQRGPATPGSPPMGTAVPREGYPPPGSPPARAMTLMRAPDGSTKQVPSDRVSFFTQRGAQVIG